MRESGRSPKEIEEWNDRFRREHAIFLPLFEADEGLRPPGLKTACFKFIYNAVVMPPGLPGIPAP